MDFEVWKRAHNFFDFETLTPIKAKGYVNPVPVFRPLGQALKDDHNKVRNPWRPLLHTPKPCDTKRKR